MRSQTSHPYIVHFPTESVNLFSLSSIFPIATMVTPRAVLDARALKKSLGERRAKKKGELQIGAFDLIKVEDEVGASDLVKVEDEVGVFNLVKAEDEVDVFNLVKAEGDGGAAVENDLDSSPRASSPRNGWGTYAPLDTSCPARILPGLPRIDTCSPTARFNLLKVCDALLIDLRDTRTFIQNERVTPAKRVPQLSVELELFQALEKAIRMIGSGLPREKIVEGWKTDEGKKRWDRVLDVCEAEALEGQAKKTADQVVKLGESQQLFGRIRTDIVIGKVARLKNVVKILAESGPTTEI